MPTLIKKQQLSSNLKSGNNITHTRHDIATLIQLDSIIFRIHELNDVAVYNPENHTLERKDIKELIEALIFPILTSALDDKKVKSYFDLLYYDELINFNKKGYNWENTLNAPALKKAASEKIITQKKKQKELRMTYNVN